MNKIAECLRSVANQLPKNNKGWMAFCSNSEPSFICDCLDGYGSMLYGYGSEIGFSTKEFLIDLGMGTGSCVFNNCPNFAHISFAESVDVQSRRIAWCLFAADLAEEWDVQ